MLPKPPKRPRKPRRPIRRKSKRKAKLHDADKLFSEYIRGRDGWACRRCGSPYSPQCAHILSRRYRSVRWSPENAVCLCQKCHMKFTHDPLAWEDWCEERFPGRLEVLKGIVRAGSQREDYEALCESLRAAIGKRGEK